MKKLGAFKIPFIIFLSLLASLFLALFLHNTIAFIIGREERAFYMLFIISFFLLPFSVLSLIISAFIEYGRRKYLINKKLRDEKEDRELGIR
jgi:heme/copper-type cytochrome/quinol oxidase subunit 1